MRNSRRKLKNISRQMTMKNNHEKSMRCCKSSAQREINSNTGLPQGEKISTWQLNPQPKWIRKRRTKPKVSRRKEIITIKDEINKIEIQRNNRKKSIKPRVGSLKGKQNWQTSGHSPKRGEKKPNKQNQNEKGEVTMDTTEMQKNNTMNNCVTTNLTT